MILAAGQFNRSILILWEGEVQVRVSRKDPFSNEVVDIWLDNLKKGTCIEVYNCFQDENTPLVDYYANSKPAVLYFVDVADLEARAKNVLALKHRLDIVKLRIKSKLVGDIDYFKYPRRFLEQNVARTVDEDIRKYRRQQARAKAAMTKAILKYVRNYRRGRVLFPKAIETLGLIRKDRRRQQKDLCFLIEKAQDGYRRSMNIRRFLAEMESNQIKDRIREMHRQMREFDSEHELVSSPTTIDSDMTSELSVKCQSFHTTRSRRRAEEVNPPPAESTRACPRRPRR